MASYLASLEVDQRQNLILQADKLQEMLGASRLIERTVEIAVSLLEDHPGVTPVTLVSGVLRFASEDLEKLATFLWDLRLQVTEESHLPCTFSIVLAEPKFKPSVDRLEERVRTNKDARATELGRPASPLFAQCLIQPHLSANLWDPEKSRGSEPRRALISQESADRQCEANDTLSNQFGEFDALKDFSKLKKTSLWNALPVQFSQLATGSNDSYFAFIKADGDGMGRLLMTLDWDNVISEVPGEKLCLQFSEAVEECLSKATKKAVDAVTLNWAYDKVTNRNRFPVAPLVRAGEDYWIVCRRDLAFRLALALGNEYARLAETTSPIPACLGSVAAAQTEKITLSFGILFAKQGFPFEAQLHMAEALVKNAKRFRKAHYAEPANGPKTGCLDFYWLESSAREDIIPYRESRLSVSDGKDCHRLFTTPWTLHETQCFLDAAESLRSSKFPSRKLQQLESILRLGQDFAQLAFEEWRRLLQAGEWGKFIEAVGKLPRRVGISTNVGNSIPFDANNQTPLLDLLKVVEIQDLQ